MLTCTLELIGPGVDTTLPSEQWMVCAGAMNFMEKTGEVSLGSFARGLY